MTYSDEVDSYLNDGSGLFADFDFSDGELPFEEKELDFDSLGINPHEATEAKPGSEDKVVMLAARYAAGVPLWNDNDRCDHGPDKVDGGRRVEL